MREAGRKSALHCHGMMDGSVFLFVSVFQRHGVTWMGVVGCGWQEAHMEAACVPASFLPAFLPPPSSVSNASVSQGTVEETIVH